MSWLGTGVVAGRVVVGPAAVVGVVLVGDELAGVWAPGAVVSVF
jgi:hypothetical protein